MKTKTKRRRLTIEEKDDIVKRLADGEKQGDIATEYRISPSAISYIKKNAGELALPPAAPAPAAPLSISGHGPAGPLIFDCKNPEPLTAALVELAAAIRANTEEMKIARRFGK